MPQIVHHAIDIAASPDAIWAVFADLSTWPRWFPRTRAARSQGDPFRPGGRIDVELEVPVAGRIPLRLDVKEVTPARRVLWHGAAYGIAGEHSYAFDDRGKWTRVTSHEELRAAGIAKSFAIRLARGRLDVEVHESLGKLRDLVEQSARTR